MQVVFAAAISLGVAVQQAPSPPLSAEDALGIKSFVIGAAVDLSPDERHLAYAVIDPTRRRGGGISFTRTGVPVAAEGGEVHVVTMPTRADTLVSDRGASSWGGVWSPDGRRLAYYSDLGGAVHVWVWERASGKARRVSESVVFTMLTHERVQWTPDSKGVLVKLLPDSLPLAAVLAVAEPSQANVVKRALPNDSVHNAPRVTVFKAGGSNGGNAAVAASWVTDSTTAFAKFRGDLAIIDVEAGSVRRVARGVPTTGYWLSPDGANVAYMRFRADAPATTNLFDLIVTSIADGSSRAVARGILQTFGRAVSWAPDGKQLAFMHTMPPGSPGRAGAALPNGSCYVVDVAGGVPRSVCGAARFGGRGGVGDPPPVWSASSTELYLTARDTVWRVPVAGSGPSAIGSLTGRELLGIVGRERAGRAWMPRGERALFLQSRDPATMRSGFDVLDLSSGKVTSVFAEDRSYSPQSYGAVDAVGGTVVYLTEDTQHPPDAWVSSADFSTRRVVTNANPQLARYRFGAGQLVHWRSSDGASLHGALILPADYRPGRSYPVIVRVYGGTRQSRFANTFVGAGDMFVMQLFATRGFVVFMPDMPQRLGTPMRDIAAAVLPGIDRLVEMGITDPERIGVLGHSYGGYSVLALLVQTNRFRAAMASAGFADLVSGYRTLWPGGGSTEASTENGQGMIGGSVWQFRDRFIENSPFYYLDRVETPVLLVHGTDDTLPIADSDQTFVALRRLGKTVEYARYEGEGHAAWSAPNAADLIARMTRWFDDLLNRSTTAPVAPARE